MGHLIGVKKIDIVHKPYDYPVNIDKGKCIKYQKQNIKVSGGGGIVDDAKSDIFLKKA